eukprot:PhF_6_TR40662/c0_g1_i1/m.61074
MIQKFQRQLLMIRRISHYASHRPLRIPSSFVTCATPSSLLWSDSGRSYCVPSAYSSPTSQDRPPPPFSLLDFDTWVEGKYKLPRRDLISLLQSNQENYVELAKGYYGVKYDSKKEIDILKAWDRMTRHVHFF